MIISLKSSVEQPFVYKKNTNLSYLVKIKELNN